MSGILTRLFERRALDENTGRGLIDKLRGGGFGPTASGITVTPESALAFSGVWACTRVLAEELASLPLIMYRRLPGGGKERVPDHPLYTLLHDAPNPEMSSGEWREACMVNTCLWGNGYNHVVFDGAARPLEIWPMLSRFMELRRDRDGELQYVTRDPAARTPAMSAPEVLHVKSMSLNGLVGLSPVAQARQAIGLGLATEQYGAAFFGNDANPGIVIKHPGVLEDEAYNNLKASWDARSGLEFSHKPVILEEGMTIDKIGIPNDDAQFLDTRKFQLRDVCRWFRMQPHLVGDLEDATFSNIEHQGLDFVIHTLRPWLTRHEQSIWRTLLRPQERRGLFAEFLVDALLRGDITSRFNAYAIARQWGWMNANDVRERENMNPIQGGNVYFAPLNMTDLAEFGQTTVAAAAASPDGDVRATITAALAYVYRDAVTRIARRAERDVADAARKHLAKGDDAGFRGWLDRFAAETKGFAERALEPAALAHVAACALRVKDPRRRVGKWVASWLRWELQWIRDTVDGARTAGIDPVEAIDDQAKHYEGRVGEWAQDVALAVADESETED